MRSASAGGQAAAVAVDVASLPVTALGGVGPRVAERLARLGLHTLQDLWFHLPLRYEDRTTTVPIRQLQAGMRAQVEGRIDAVERGFRYRPVLRVAISDASKATLSLRFFHFRGTQVDQFRPGGWLRCHGDVRVGAQGLEIVHPSYRVIDPGQRGHTEERLTPIYPVTEGVGQAALARVIERALERLPGEEQLELLPAGVRRGLQLPPLADALRSAHHPPAGAVLQSLADGSDPALRRLAFEELLAHHLSLRRQRVALRRNRALALDGKARLQEALLAQLPFALTGAQQRVFAEVRADLARTEPMLRLVQGDVGSGKTVVAALAALLAIGSGRQVALMAPTELLAEQHARNFAAWLQPLGIEPVWLAGKVKGRARTAALARIAEGAPMVVGTHALMQEGVEFATLGLVIIDEQHRFGVHQRLALRDKGLSGTHVPHQLVMTATPIPRTLAMTAYADLDVSAIDELPPGRTPVHTVAISGERRDEVVQRIRAACAEGRQAYWVCTLIEDSDEIEAQTAQGTFEALSRQLPEVRVGLVHGRLKPAEKQQVMDAFRDGHVQLLVATTVIEVGVDVPNASLMLIENAERLGLSQLHQLRGRVGRGAAASTCVLLYQSPLSALARERLDVMRRSNDGFEIAEKDLELRGPGELLGTRQTGVAGMRVADLARDAGLLPDVRRVADLLLQDHEALAERLVARWVGSAERFAGA